MTYIQNHHTDNTLAGLQEIQKKLPSWDNYWKRFSGQSLVGTYYQNQVKKIIYSLLIGINLDTQAPILDFGCGRGRTLGYFREWGFPNSFGMDVSKEAIEICEKNGFKPGRDVFLIEPGKDYFKDKEFSLVFSEGLLEHYEVFSPLIKAMARISCRYIMLMQPNHFSFFGRVLNFATELVAKEKEIKEISHPIQKFIARFEEEGFRLKKKKETVLSEFAVILLERRDA